MLSGGRVGVLLAIQLVSSACTGATPVPTPSPAPAAAAGCTTEQRIATNAPHEFDAEDLRAAALPRSELGTTYAAYVFDPGFGGFESNYERVRDKADRKDEERRALERYGRLVAYQSMFTATDRSAAVERIWTLVALFRDGAGASGYLANAIASSTATGAAEFALAGLGEEARGAGARAYVRRGRLLGQVGINARGPTDLRSELTALAQKLDDRLQRSVSGALRGYTGKPGTEIGAERVQSLALPRADLGPAYAGLDEDAFLNGFQDNLERAQT
ncbi:MAG TPA: hypothetical protein VFM93_11355, partial [Candidatus Limnocylindria bacterium]|nr:hypothetical protein [Candidatus Limnocylindria bacterium]